MCCDQEKCERYIVNMNICHLPPKLTVRKGVSTKRTKSLSTDLVSVRGSVAADWGTSVEGKKLVKTFPAGEPWLVGVARGKLLRLVVP